MKWVQECPSSSADFWRMAEASDNTLVIGGDRETKAAIQIVYHAGGGTSVYESCPLQRCFRDVQAAAQHFQIHSANFESGGRVMLGLEPGTPHL
jgi:hypothetical protein